MGFNHTLYFVLIMFSEFILMSVIIVNFFAINCEHKIEPLLRYVVYE